MILQYVYMYILRKMWTSKMNNTCTIRWHQPDIVNIDTFLHFSTQDVYDNCNLDQAGFSNGY